jgi:hypothetical protein
MLSKIWSAVLTHTAFQPCRPVPVRSRSSYSPGVMRWAVVVPAFMIHTPPCLGLSSNPSDCVVAPGTAIVMWYRACSWSGPPVDGQHDVGFAASAQVQRQRHVMGSKRDSVRRTVVGPFDAGKADKLFTI